jgi:vacuolar-type H+-ATPase subunit H
VPQLRAFPDRFRPAGAPGAAARSAVPVDRSRELEAELAPVLALLDSVDAECARVVAQARRDAARIVAAAREVATAQLGDAERRARAGRDEAAQEVLAAARAEAADTVACASRQALQVRELAAQRIPALVSRAVGLVRALQAECSGPAADRPDRPGVPGGPP